MNSSTILIPNPVYETVSPLVEAGYARGERHYHTIDHAAEVLVNVERLHSKVGFRFPAESALAALYHDICYVPGDPLNEDKSALEAMRDLQELDVIDISRVAVLIWLTKYHFKMGGLLAGDVDAQLFLDADILGFAAPWKQFEEQNKKLDIEFSSLTKDRKSYLIGRRAFLQNIYSNTGVFNSDYCKDRFEERALNNIDTAVTLLDEELKGM